MHEPEGQNNLQWSIMMNWTHLQYTIGFGIGSDRAGQPIHPEDSDDALDRIRAAAFQQFMGYTLIETQGGWHDPETGRVHVEEGRSLIVLIDKQAEYEPNLALFARMVGRQLNQASVVLIGPDGQAAFIDID